MKPLRFRFSIASLAVVVALVAIDIVWIRTIFTTHRSIFGFTAEGYDAGLFLMANVLPFGFYPMIYRRGAAQRFVVGFEVGGLAAALGYAVFAWIAPETLREATSMPLEPIWDLCSGWLSNGTLKYLIIFAIFLAVGLGIPQLLAAVACGILIRRGCERRCKVVEDSRRGGEAEGSTEISDERSGRHKVNCTVSDSQRVMRPGIARSCVTRRADSHERPDIDRFLLSLLNGFAAQAGL